MAKAFLFALPERILPFIDTKGLLSYDNFEMRAKKFFVFLFLPSLLSSFLLCQTLAEIAKKERERRESLKGKNVKIITNADLAKMKKKPALEILAEATPSVTEEAKTAETPAPLAQESQGEPPPAAPNPEPKSQSTLNELQQKWEKAKEYVDLLTMKMGALWQEYYGLDATTPKEAIQQSISETFIKLEKAQEEEAKARQELEKFLSQAKKESAPSIWIR